MSISFRKSASLFAATVLASGLSLASFAGCGSGSNNDQGTSFLALGFFDDGDLEQGDSGTTVFLNEALPTQVFPLSVPIDKDPDEEGIQGGFLGLENHLAVQFIRTVRVDCSYDVPGSSISIPNDSYAVTTVLGQAGGDDAQDEPLPTRSFVQIQIVSPDVMSYLSVNQSSLPQLPFALIATCSAVGVTQSGDVLTTNPVFYQVQFAERPPTNVSGTPGIPPDTGPGTGGDTDGIDGGAGSDSDALVGAEDPSAVDDGSSDDPL